MPISRNRIASSTPPTSNSTSKQPYFSAITSSTRLIYSLLRCIGFAPIAQVHIMKDFVRVSVEDSRSMQAHVMLEKTLFTTYNFTPPRREKEIDPESTEQSRAASAEDDENDEDDTVTFGISLSALLECLQIFGVTETKESRWGGGGAGRDGSVFGSSILSRDGPAGAFDQQSLRVQGTCRLLYPGEGEPLSVIIEEGGLVTTCELTTYQPEAYEELPLARDSLAMKVIMRSTWLHDAIAELDANAQDHFVITANSTRPWFVLSSLGPVGSSSVEFSNDRSLLEVFNVSQPCQNRYKYSLVKYALKAMNMAGKVSLRTDTDGVLSMQFMVENEITNNPSFLDFRYLPQRINESSDEDTDEEDGEEEEEEDEGEEGNDD